MAPRYTFEQALQILEIDASAGPRNAKRALMIQLQRHGPEPSPEDYARFTGAYDVLKDPKAWPDYEAPEVWDHDLAPRPQRRLPPGHSKSARTRPAPTPTATTHEGDAPGAGWRAPQPGDKSAARPQGAPSARRDHIAKGSPQKARPASPPNPLLDNEAVVTALTRLEKNYAILPKEILVEHMAQEGSNELIAFLNGLLESGEFLATGAAVATLLDLMNGDESFDFVNSRGVVSILIGVFAQADTDPKAITVAASIQRAYDRWATASELNPPVLDIGTRDSLRFTRSLAALPEEFPPELIAATAGALRGDDLAEMKAQFASWIEAHKEQAEDLKRMLARSAPALLHVVGELFPERASATERIDLVWARSKTYAQRVGLGLLVCLVAWFAIPGESPESLERKALANAQRALCDYAGKDHPTCSLSKFIVEALPESNCAIIEPLVPQFVSAVHSMKNNTGGLASAVDLGALNAIKSEADKIVIAAQRRCAGI